MIHLRIASLALFVGAAALSSATITNYRAIWSGASLGNTAKATAIVGIDLEKVAADAGTINGFVPISGTSTLQSISLDFTDSSGVTTQWITADFNIFVLDLTLAIDVTTDWVGQAQANSVTFGNGALESDFNLGLTTLGAPTGSWYYELSRGSDAVHLVSFAPVPEPASMAVLGLAALKRRRKV